MCRTIGCSVVLLKQGPLGNLLLAKKLVGAGAAVDAAGHMHRTSSLMNSNVVHWALLR